MIARVKITTYGCKEYLRRIGLITEGELVYTEIRPKRITVSEIQERVADKFHIPLGDMKSSRRAREVARPRQVAMYLSKRFTRQSLPEIGRRFGNRDHTTVLHACRQVEKLMGEDPELHQAVTALSEGIEGELRREW